MLTKCKQSLFLIKKSLKIPKRKSIPINRRRTDDTISKAAFDGGNVTVWVAVLLIVNYTYMSYSLTSMAFHTVTT